MHEKIGSRGAFPRGRLCFLNHCVGVVALLFATLYNSTVFAEGGCSPIGTDIPIESTLASAGFFANLRYSESSIHYQMDKLLERAQIKLKEAITTSKVCPGSCANPVLGIVFSSTPNLEYSGYSDHSKCEAYFKQTKEHPIIYGNRRFDSKQEAEDWYNDLTQGDGTDGEDLYRLCSGSCSPKYSSFIASQNGQLTITTSIICGHARDKDDDQYKLASALRWQCLPSS